MSRACGPLLLALLVALLGAGCGDAGDLVLIPNTTTRVGKVFQEKGTQLRMRIFREVDECQGAGVVGDLKTSADRETLGLCLPHVDRRAGEVRVGIQLRNEDGVVPLSLTKDHITVAHQGRLVQDGAADQHVKVIPHNPRQTNQLYVLLIDGSRSMAEQANRQRTRMGEVKAALRMQEVQDAFFREDERSGVVLLQFTDGDPRPVGGSFKVLESPEDYVAAVDQLQVLGGYTHLYDAIAWSSKSLLEIEDIKRAVDFGKMELTIVALTDGFNNEKRDDTCGTNAVRLRTLVEQLDDLREGTFRNGRGPPRVFSVGLGRPIQDDFELPRDWETRVSERDLCGRYANTRIDGDLELRGIDNASLEWIARAGGGQAFVRQGKEGLGEAFRSSAARRYEWFEVRYRLDPFFLRRAFTTRLRLNSFYTAEAYVKVHPSAWLDAPPGKVDADGWTITETYWHTMVVLTPAVGLLMVLSYLGAAVFNARRALMGRNRRGGVGD